MSEFTFIPALDILGGEVVRLAQGEYDAVTRYPFDLVARAVAYAEEGAEWLHLVDLDAARGEPGALDARLPELIGLGMKLQVGGGVRSKARATALLELGVSRVVIGTAAVREPEWVAALCEERGANVCVAVDAKGESVAVSGWTETSDISLDELALRATDWGAGALLYTDIARDGMSAGPNVERTAALQKRVNEVSSSTLVIASGGLRNASDVRRLREAGVLACVCGKALLTGSITVEAGMGGGE